MAIQMPESVEAVEKKISEVKSGFSEIINDVDKGKYRVIVQRYNETLAAIISADDLEWFQLLEEHISKTQPEWFQQQHREMARRKMDREQRKQTISELRQSLKKTRAELCRALDEMDSMLDMDRVMETPRKRVEG